MLCLHLAVIEWEGLSSLSGLRLLLQSGSIFTAMQGDPNITHNAWRKTTSSPHPFRESSHITGVAKDGGGEMKWRRREEDGELEEDDRSSLCLTFHLHTWFFLLTLTNIVICWWEKWRKMNKKKILLNAFSRTKYYIWARFKSSRKCSKEMMSLIKSQTGVVNMMTVCTKSNFYQI